MRKIILISLFGAFLVQALSGLFIWAAFQLNRDYISDNLCINRFDAIPVCKGTCYLEKKLGENEKQQQDLPELKLNGTLLFYDDRKVEINKPFDLLLIQTTFSLPGDSALYDGASFPIFKPPVLIG